MKDKVEKKKKIKWASIVYNLELYNDFLKYRDSHPKVFKKGNNDRVAFMYLLHKRGRDFVALCRRLSEKNPDAIKILKKEWVTEGEE